MFGCMIYIACCKKVESARAAHSKASARAPASAPTETPVLAVSAALDQAQSRSIPLRPKEAQRFSSFPATLKRVLFFAARQLEAVLLELVVVDGVRVVYLAGRHRLREVGVQVYVQLVRQQLLVVGARLGDELVSELRARRGHKDVTLVCDDHLSVVGLYAQRRASAVLVAALPELPLQESEQGSRLCACAAPQFRCSLWAAVSVLAPKSTE